MALHSQQWMRKGGLKLAPRSDFRGCILRDAVGLGKSLTALVAALELRDELPKSHPRRGPVLVVCRSGCIFQWVEEIRKHWKRAHRPSVLVFNNRAYPHDALTKYDVVISSHTFVRGLLHEEGHRALRRAKDCKVTEEDGASSQPEHSEAQGNRVQCPDIRRISRCSDT
ncbi:hypothetical protein MRS44_002394 [Fusarium solani]|uniref:uncharacterized protein n=1 Tax=Fusarium solani TaxID=169388 RepID=UPI0032C3DBDE|nr:hypothetical protein MRS44_002394 [Fusarium solani]